MDIYYIAYGSNINKKEMQERCKGAQVVDYFLLDGYRLVFHIYLTIEKDNKSKVPVVIWKINKEHEKALDKYEAVDEGLYRKEYITLNVKGIKRKCLIYLMNDIDNRDNAIPSDIYINTCLHGYKDFGFDPKYLLEETEKTK